MRIAKTLSQTGALIAATALQLANSAATANPNPAIELAALTARSSLLIVAETRSEFGSLTLKRFKSTLPNDGVLPVRWLVNAECDTLRRELFSPMAGTLVIWLADAEWAPASCPPHVVGFNPLVNLSPAPVLLIGSTAWQAGFSAALLENETDSTVRKIVHIDRLRQFGIEAASIPNDWTQLNDAGKGPMTRVSGYRIAFLALAFVGLTLSGLFSYRLWARTLHRAKHHQAEPMLGHLGVGTWHWQIDSGAIVLNETWAAQLGYRLEELKPTTIATWERFSHPDDLAHSKTALAQHLDGQTPIYARQTRLRHRDGHWIPMLQLGRALTPESGQPVTEMVGLHLDLRDLGLDLTRHASGPPRIYQQRLHALIHTTRSTVAALLGRQKALFELLLERSPTPRQFAELSRASAINRVVNAALQSVEDITRILDGNFSLTINACDLRRLLERVNVAANGLITNDQVAMSVTIEPGTPTRVFTDEDRLAYSLIRMLGFTIARTDQGSIELSLRLLSTRDNKGLFRILIRDTGIGLSSGERAALEMTFQSGRLLLSEQGRINASLIAVAAVLDMMNGEVFITANEMGGTDFSLELELPLLEQASIAPENRE